MNLTVNGSPVDLPDPKGRTPLALDRGRAWQTGRLLDAEVMNEAAGVLIRSRKSR